MFKQIFISLLTLSLLSCGYTFQGSGSILPPDVKRVYIPLVENNTSENQLTNLLTEALRERFDRFGVVTVVDSLASADAVLNAKVVKLTRSTATSSGRSDIASLLDAKLLISAELERVSGGILWRDATLSVSRSYGSNAGSVVTSSSSFAAGSISASDLAGLSTREVSREQEQEALTQLAEAVARKIYDESVAPDF